MVSRHGSEIIGDHHSIKKQIDEAIQLIVSMEEFLKHGQMKYSSLKNLPRTIMHFINCINSTCHRKGMGTKLIKNHLYFHLTDYISLWGSPTGWDSNAASLINQTTQQKSEKMMLTHATYYYNLNPPDPPLIEHPDAAGSHFEILKTVNGQSSMRCLHSTNKTKPFFSSVILDFVCDNPKKTASEFVKCGSLINSLYLFHVDTIHSELSVVPELGKDGCTTNCEWLVISNCVYWLDFFERKNATTPTAYESLYNACTLKDEIQLEPFEIALNDNKSSDYLTNHLGICEVDKEWVTEKIIGIEWLNLATKLRYTVTSALGFAIFIDVCNFDEAAANNHTVGRGYTYEEQRRMAPLRRPGPTMEAAANNHTVGRGYTYEEQRRMAPLRRAGPTMVCGMEEDRGHGGLVLLYVGWKKTGAMVLEEEEQGGGV
eukprot:jgi/Psemu1/18944/gm1.18944_g